MDIFIRDYVRARFARLPSDSLELAVSIYKTPHNVAAVGRGVGLDYAICQFTGIPNNKMSTLPAPASADTESGATPASVPVRSSEVYCRIFEALVGAVFSEKGPWATRHFLDGLLFSAQFNTSLLCRPRNPMVKLARVLIEGGRSEPDYRLLHESGRLSNNSIFVVGVYSGVEKLAEGKDRWARPS